MNTSVFAENDENEDENDKAEELDKVQESLVPR